MATESATKMIAAALNQEEVKRTLTETNRQNRHFLTQCPKCDKPGHAYYYMRRAGLIVLKYVHSNEPHVGYPRQCWIGSVVSESDVIRDMKNDIKQETHKKLVHIAKSRPRDPITGQFIKNIKTSNSHEEHGS